MSFLEQNPVALILDLAQPTVIQATGQVQALSPADYLAANPRTIGSVAVTLGGTITNNDPVTANFAAGFLPGGLAVTVTALTGDTLATLAAKLAKAINDNSTLQNYGVYADAVGAVVTANWPGPLASSVTLSIAVGGAATETSTLNPISGIPTGGSGPVIPYQTFQYAFQGSVLEFRAGQPFLVTPQLAAALARDAQLVY